jgi:radical SAM superfamily enzyme YgiQ (UPF0313 family)
MSECGCGAILIGFESISQDNLKAMHKSINQRFGYADAIAKIQSYGILVHSAFIVGYDHDTETGFNELVDFIQKTNLLMPLINVLTPFPGTELFKRLEMEGRILHKDWSKYDAKHVVFQHAKLSAEELENGFRKVVTSVYSFDSIWKKLNYYWGIDFWKRANELDPVKLSWRIIFALRLCTMLSSRNLDRSKFILKVLPKIFGKRVRISTILTMMAYNDFACSLKESKVPDRPAKVDLEAGPILPLVALSKPLQPRV